MDNHGEDRHLSPDFVLPADGPVSHAPTCKPVVLLVDPVDRIREQLSQWLLLQGFAVHVASAGDQAIDFCRRHPGAVNAILLDLRFSEREGLRTFRSLRLLEPALCCCFISDRYEPAIEESLIRQGAVCLLPKPLDRWCWVSRFLHRLCALSPWPPPEVANDGPCLSD